ncbi:MAG: hypothetical protein ACREQR_04245 [Candidatus Binataceae bacterium]
MPPAQALPFKGRLVEGDPDEIPPSVALSLTEASPIRFSYREELTHNERHTALWMTALAPSTYFSTPLGEYYVTAFATLSIYNGDKVIGSYTAKARVSRTYTLYAEPTHAELEHQARDAVRAKIDAQLANDTDRLNDAIAESTRAAGPSLNR